MRLFVAINFDKEIKEKMLAVQSRLRELGRGNFSRPENLHLTLAFLGEVSPNRIVALRRAMDDTPVHPMKLTFDHVGSFKRNGGDIWWIGLAENKILTDLQSNLSLNLAVQGFPLESRRFSPHITLAREVAVQAAPNRKALLGDSPSVDVNAMNLMCSERIGGKLTYTEQYTVTAQYR